MKRAMLRGRLVSTARVMLSNKAWKPGGILMLALERRFPALESVAGTAAVVSAMMEFCVFRSNVLQQQDVLLFIKLGSRPYVYTYTYNHRRPTT